MSEIRFDPSLDYYGVLGVKENASTSEIKRAYRRLAKKYHPDSTGGDKRMETRFKEVSNAYDVLSDKDTRAQYDAIRKGGVPFGFDGRGGNPGGNMGADFGELFAQMFSGATGQSRRGGPGGVRFSYSSGMDSDPEMVSDLFSGNRAPEGRRRGRPQRRTSPEAPAEKKIRAADGSPLTQRGADIHSEVRLKFDEAILGTTKTVSTLGGKATVKIPPGTSSGKKLRLKGKGAPKSGGHGDHFVTTQIDVPKGLDSRGQKLLAELMKTIRK